MQKELTEYQRKQIQATWEKVITLIKSHMWGGVTLDRFNLWRKQFESEEDQYTAAYLVQQLIYYNKTDFVTILTYTFAQCLKYLSLNDFGGVGNIDDINDDNWKLKLEETKRNILVCPLSIDSPASSGFMVARILRNQGIIAEDELCNNYNDLVNKLIRRQSIKGIILVDDLIGSGTQAIDAINKPQEIKGNYTSLTELLEKDFSNIPLLIAVAVAPKDSIEKIESLSKCRVFAGETLLNHHSILNSEFWNAESYEQGIKSLQRLQADKRIPFVGFNDNAWAVAFDHGVPDVTSPFYYEENKEWKALLRRRGEDI
jgi:hypothetical protein